MKIGMAAALAALLLVGCDWMSKKDPPGEMSEAELAEARQERLRRACASEATYDRLKELAFDEAVRVRGQAHPLLDQVAANAVVRMEEPVVKSRDEELNVTVCTGTFILELPPGAENAFDGERRLTAEIEYAAQAAVDGSGLVYDMEGAEPIIYRLATIGGLRSAEAGPITTPPPSGVPGAQRVPAPEDPPTATVAPQPEPEPRERRARGSANPSFNCRHARTRTEIMICASDRLAAADRRMASIYYAEMARADAGTRRELRRTRDSFLARRERCGSASCVAGVYRDRIGEIRGIAGR